MLHALSCSTSQLEIAKFFWLGDKSCDMNTFYVTYTN